MGILNVVCTDSLGENNRGMQIPAIEAEPLQAEDVATGGATVQSSVFPEKTRLVTLNTSTAVRVVFGENPNAESDPGHRITAGMTRTFTGDLAGKRLAAVEV